MIIMMNFFVFALLCVLVSWTSPFNTEEFIENFTQNLPFFIIGFLISCAIRYLKIFSKNTKSTAQSTTEDSPNAKSEE